MGIGPDGYYSLREILGYNAKYNIVLSDRGRGKSYGTKLFLMDQEGTAMCLYRNGPDMASAMMSWIDPLVEQGYDPAAFEYEGSEKDGFVLSFNGRKKVWFRAITGVNRIKQEVFPNDMNWVWLDEFIPLAYKKLPGVESEGDAIRTIIKTIEHDTVHTREEKGLKPLRVLMYANPFTWNNPILSYFHIDPRAGYGIHRAGPGVVYEILEPEPEKPTHGRKMTPEEFLGDEVNRNQGWLKQDAFVMPLPKGCVPYQSVRIGKKYYVFYKSQAGQKWIVEKSQHADLRGDYNADSVIGTFGTLDGLQEIETCITRDKRNRLEDFTMQGKYRFDSVNTKFDWLRSLEEV